MSAYNIIVNDVQKSENKVVCLARIDNYQNMLKHVSVGESITTSEPININFNNSVGASKWVLIYYPRGQYIPLERSRVFGDGRASMYLKMISCENEDRSLRMTVNFFIKSPYFEMEDKFACSKHANFLYRDVYKRWSGPFDLVSLNELYSKNCENYFFNDCLTIGCELVYTSPPRLQSSKSVAKGVFDNWKRNTDANRNSFSRVEHQLNDYVEERKKIPTYRRSSSVLQNTMDQKNEIPMHEGSRESNKKNRNYRLTMDQKDEIPMHEGRRESNKKKRNYRLTMDQKDEIPMHEGRRESNQKISNYRLGMDRKDEIPLNESRRESNKKIINFRFTYNKDSQTWHQRLLQNCNQKKETNNENNPPNRQNNIRSREAATSNTAIQVPNESYDGYSVKQNIELFEKLSTRE